MVRVNAQAFLKDGPQVTWAKGDETVVTGSRIETPDHTIDVGFQISSNDCLLSFETASLQDLHNGDELTIEDEHLPARSGRYSVIDVSPLWDGVFSRASLRKL